MFIYICVHMIWPNPGSRSKAKRCLPSSAYPRSDRVACDCDWPERQRMPLPLGELVSLDLKCRTGFSVVWSARNDMKSSDKYIFQVPSLLIWPKPGSRSKASLSAWRSATEACSTLCSGSDEKKASGRCIPGKNMRIRSIKMFNRDSVPFPDSGLFSNVTHNATRLRISSARIRFQKLQISFRRRSRHRLVVV